MWRIENIPCLLLATVKEAPSFLDHLHTTRTVAALHLHFFSWNSTVVLFFSFLNVFLKSSNAYKVKAKTAED